MKKYWCVNFAEDDCLQYGLAKNLWLMGYQWAADQSDTANRKAVITTNWRALEDISTGDTFVAYLRPRTFYAIGNVIGPRRKRTSGDRTDTIANYLERRESYHNGFVYFTSSVVYEDFTDEFRGYPVRIDVDRWVNCLGDGVAVPGVLKHIQRSMVRRAAFKIPKRLFQQIERELARRFAAERDQQPVGKLHTATDQAAADAIEICQAKGQGFQLDGKLRKELENRAMEVATRYFTSLGYVVHDHSTNHPYDLLCIGPKGALYVEVKGTQSSGDALFLTRGEVDFARRHKGKMALFILHSIKVSENREVSGGVRRVVNPWDVDKGRLRPMSFEYELTDETSASNS